MRAHGPEEILGADEAVILARAEHADRHEVGSTFDIVQVLGDPEQRLQVAQPALALFYVGFDHVAFALPQVAPVALFQLGLGELPLSGGEQILFQSPVEVVVK